MKSFLCVMKFDEVSCHYTEYSVFLNDQVDGGILCKPPFCLLFESAGT